MKGNKGNNTKHGHTKAGQVTSEYRAWNSMKTRCYNANYIGHRYYKNNGITVCDKWMNSFEAFLEDMGLNPSKSHSLDRINNKLGYYKENCRWATKKEQAVNRNNTVFYEMDGLRMHGLDWSKYLGVTYQAIRRYIKIYGFEKAHTFYTNKKSLSN